MEHSTHPEHCLNCGKHLRGRYCSNCGQDSAEHQDSIWHLGKHFFQDITHYDGKLWLTVKPLLLKPGFVTIEYLSGKRAKYLNPVRLFIFLNFIFFLLVAWLPDMRKDGDKQKMHITIKTKDDLNVAKYDSLQNLLPPEKRDGHFSRAYKLKLLGNVDRMKTDPHFMLEIIEAFTHNLAKVTFLFLIVCACLLKLLYYRSNILMINHLLFAIHLSCTFLLLSVLMLFISYLPYSNYLNMLVFLYGVIYFYRALLVVYRQGRIKTAFKFTIVSLLLAAAIFLGFFLNALVTVLSADSNV